METDNKVGTQGRYEELKATLGQEKACTVFREEVKESVGAVVLEQLRYDLGTVPRTMGRLKQMIMNTKTEPKRDRKPQAPKKVTYLNTHLACQRCDTLWQVIDFNPEPKVVKCPTCGEPNDIREAIKRAS